MTAKPTDELTDYGIAENLKDGTILSLDTYSFAKPQKLSIYFHKFGELDPCDDITPRESVLLAMALAACQSNVMVDLESFVKDHKLERHFKP